MNADGGSLKEHSKICLSSHTLSAVHRITFKRKEKITQQSKRKFSPDKELWRGLHENVVCNLMI